MHVPEVVMQMRRALMQVQGVAMLWRAVVV
jgi:hypothetical protein